MSAAIVDVTGRVAELYQENPQTFVARRNELARDLARAGQRDLSARIKTLTKPPASAWVVNQLYWHERGEYEALLAAGSAAREAQQSRLSGRGGDLARALGERDAIIDRLARRAEPLAAAGGVVLSRDVRARVRTSLEAIALRAGDASLVHGQLTEDVALPGLQALAGLIASDGAPTAPAPSRRTLALVPTPEREADREVAALTAALDEVREALEAARTASAEAQDRADEDAGAVTVAEQQVLAATRALEAAQQRLSQAKDVVRSATEHAAVTAADAARAADDVEGLVDREAELAARLAALTEPPPRTPGAKPRRVSRKR